MPASLDYSGPPADASAIDGTQHRIDDALDAVNAAALSFASRIIKDVSVRQQYRTAIREAVDEIRADIVAGRITVEQAALRANHMRNVILDLSRGNSSDLGRSVAEYLKLEGKTFEQLISYYSNKIFSLEVTSLSAVQRDAVMREIIAAAGRDNAGVTALLRYLGPAARGAVALSVGLAVYDICKAPNWQSEALHQGVVVGAGVGGSYLIGAVGISLICGPGEPLCAGIFILVGGVGFSVGADYFWRKFDVGDSVR